MKYTEILHSNIDYYSYPNCHICGTYLQEQISRTEIPATPFIDEKGNEHTHNKNLVMTRYECKNNHRIKVYSTYECSCGWKSTTPCNNDHLKIVDLPPERKRGTPIPELRDDSLTDWNGAKLSHRILNSLQPGCIVRVVVRASSTSDSSWEQIYFKIVRYKDGTFWGKCLDTYRSDDFIGLPDGDILPFRKEHIVEVPINWQPKWLQRQWQKYYIHE